MKKTPIFFMIIGLCVSCSGPSLFKNQKDFFGGNQAAAVANHCSKTGNMNREGMAYRLCQKSFETHFGK
jgi:hypothetical protein